MELPEVLQQALTRALASTSAKDISRTTEALSQRYRAGHALDQQTFLRSPDDVIAYAAYRMPATFAALYATLAEITQQLPAWQPRTFLDVGAGPGTAMWAATSIWPKLESITLLERDQHMLRLGQTLTREASIPALQQARWLRTDVTHAWESAKHDLVVGSYVLGELPREKHAEIIEQLWSYTSGVLLIVEPGTPRGFALIRAIREQLLHLGAHMIAPCPHQQACPMPDNDWCHFAQRLSRSKLQRNLKGGTLAYEDEKFSYIAVSRTPPAQPMHARIIRHPQKRGGHVHLELCTPQGLQHTVVARSAGSRYKTAQNARWGDVFPAEETAG
jgi:ribosomal protein RSM22 (predicted rRNA methylase)